MMLFRALGTNKNRIDRVLTIEINMAQQNFIFNLPPDQVKQIERQIISGKSLASLSREHGVTENTLRHFRDNHLGARMLAGASRSLKQHTESLLQDMVDIMQTSKDILASAMEDNHRNLSLKAIKEIRNNVETTGKILFSIQQQATQGLDPAEIAEFKKWKADRENLGPRLRALSPEDQEKLRQRAIQQLASGSYSNVQDVEILPDDDPDPGNDSDPPQDPPPPVRKMRRKKPR